MTVTAHSGPCASLSEAEGTIRKYRRSFSGTRCFKGQEAALTNPNDVMVHFLQGETVIGFFCSFTRWIVIFPPEPGEDPNQILLDGIAVYFNYPDFSAVPQSIKPHIRTLAMAKQPGDRVQ